MLTTIQSSLVPRCRCREEPKLTYCTPADPVHQIETEAKVLATLEVQRYSKQTYGGGLMDVKIELDRRVEALFNLIGYLATFVVDAAANREALCRSFGLKAHLASTATTIRGYCLEHGILVGGWRFRDAFTQAFNGPRGVDHGSNRDRASGPSEGREWGDTGGIGVGGHHAAGICQYTLPAAVGAVGAGVRRGRRRKEWWGG